MALGASPFLVIRTLVGRTFAPVAVGVGVGLFGAWLASCAMSPFVVGVSATDPRLFLGAAVAIAVVALLGALVPIRRAARVDPVAVLRDV
jgi:ABC-type antimicrobial peptide transport system permease subunit